MYLSPKYISNLNSCVDWEALPDLKKVKIDTQLLWSDRNMYLPCSKKDNDGIWNQDIRFPKVETIHITDSRLINPRPSNYYYQNNLNLPSFHSFLNLQRGTKRLLIKYYNLSHIPYAIRNMEELEELDLSNNKIREFGLGRDKNYKNLRKINLSKNKLQRIHKNIKIASVLKHLDLSENNLKKYTDIKALEKLYWLETVDLRNNPIARDKGIIEYLQYDLPNTTILH
ncbi:MAG: protein phosphatase 1 regulatory subunit 42 [Saprospiraceae bacterium]|nr:protein phosphatase 1 regulatory subunit 42 [Saprospiraceae bacterium]